MEGNTSVKRLSKKKFEMKLSKLSTSKPTDMLSSIEDLSKYTTRSASHSEQEQQSILDIDLQHHLSQVDTQVDMQMESREFMKSSLYTTEENSDDSPINFSKPYKKPKNLDAFSELTTNTSLYTQEEPSDEVTPSKIATKFSKIHTKKSSFITPDSKELNSDSDSQEISLPIKRKKSFKKVSAVPLKIFNKLIDIKKDSFIETGESYDLDEIEITVTPKEKVFNCSFMDRFKNNKIDKPNHTLAKGVLTDSSIYESLEIQAPKKLEGFFMRKPQITPRDILRESLKNEINKRKTTHINTECIFAKMPTDLPGKLIKKAQDDGESDYIPEDNEETEALEMEKIIRLEEGEESKDSEESDKSEKSQDTDMETESESTETENKNPHLDDSNKNMDIDDNPLEDSQNDSITVASETIPDTKLHPPILNSIFSTTTNASQPFVNFIKKPKNKFIDEEAELGSDHEEHDDLIKNIRDSDLEISEELDKDLEEIIDRDKVDDDEEMRYGKHLDQLMKDDDENIKKVVNAEFRRQRKDLDLIENGLGIMSKKDKLLEERKSLLAQRGTQVFSQNSKGINPEEMDDEELDRYKALKGSQELKFIRNQFSSKVMLDDKSLSIFNLISKPENSIASKSMLVGSDKSNSMRVFKSSTNLSSNRSFVFSKDKSITQAFEKTQTKKTKLYKLLSN
ncbi:hypothetical protein SteCoe_12308 [Stentor coeruleus]|uniref:Uncharacterized protein n=1 Tax=Stentor coeruleus TaxID=5963 RepID=A0A1R2CB67_9CILI|nr:hypothetical protein SteCoe_12308 [Stentor coeruleus]